MQSEFAFFQCTREELVELHRSLLNRFLMDNVLRREQGLEPVDESLMLRRLEDLLRISPDEAHTLLHQTEDELWAYSWYSYTEEWAWFRAKQDVLKELGANAKRTKREALARLIEEKYQRFFKTYVAEVDMHRQSEKKKKKKNLR